MHADNGSLIAPQIIAPTQEGFTWGRKSCHGAAIPIFYHQNDIGH